MNYERIALVAVIVVFLVLHAVEVRYMRDLQSQITTNQQIVTEAHNTHDYMIKNMTVKK